jgi:hypothetical protein
MWNCGERAGGQGAGQQMWSARGAMHLQPTEDKLALHSNAPAWHYITRWCTPPPYHDGHSPRSQWLTVPSYHPAGIIGGVGQRYNTVRHASPEHGVYQRYTAHANRPLTDSRPIAFYCGHCVVRSLSPLKIRSDLSHLRP